MLSRSLESRNPSSAVNHGGFELSMHRSSASEINMRDSSSYGRVKSDTAVPRFLGCVDLDITQGGDVYLSGEESTKFKVSFYRLDQQNFQIPFRDRANALCFPRPRSRSAGQLS